MVAHVEHIGTGYKPRIFLQGAPQDKYRCTSCGKVLKDPVQTYCGHRYCRQCIEYVLESNGKPECQACIAEGVHDSLLSLDQIYKDRAILREMSDIRVRCINDGCDWKGTFKQYDQEHFTQCPFEKIICIKDGCGAEIYRNQLVNHLQKECMMRLVVCQYCENQVVHKEQNAHILGCSRYPTTCQFCRKKDIPRGELKNHQDTEKGDCPKKPIFCKFKDVGCVELIEQDKARDHDKRSISEHLLLLLNTVIPFLSIVRNLKDRNGVDQVKEQVQRNSTELETLSSEVQKLDVQVQQLHSNCASAQRFPSGTVTAGVDSLKSQLEGLNNKQTVLQTKVSTYEAIVAVLNNQIERDAGAIQTLQRQRKQDREIIESLELKIKSQDRIIALKDVAMAEQDLRIQSLEMASYNGELVWKISNFFKKRQEAISSKTTSIYSPCFYTSRHGYKMCARIYLNGDGMGKGNHVSVFFTIMKGPFDALLRWPFRQKVTLMWLDQNNKEHVIDAFRPDPTSSSFKRPVQDMNIASGCPLFMPLSQLDSPRHAYIKDDVAFLKIMVDVSDLD